MILIDERPALEPQIDEVVSAAFGQGAEARLVDDLRRSGDLVISLVAARAGEICGHVALSRLRSPPHALALAPLAVRPAFQRQGIGALLVRAAIERAHHLGASIIFLLGDPAYYERFGFSAVAAADYPSAYAGPHFMALRLGDTPVPPAPVIYAEAFDRLT